jgi:SAM-dependent methyltransferase
MNDNDLIEATATEQFAERMLGVLNDACLAVMASLGHRTGLFDAMAGQPPATSAEVAARARLQERYVREWLGAMTVGGVVSYDPETRCYQLPDAHAASLTRSAGPENLAGTMQFVSLLAGVEAEVSECFRVGGGVPYSAYGEFHRLMAEDSAAVHDAALVEAIIPLVPGLTERLTDGIDVADIGCGSGHAVNLLAAAFPASRFAGYDFAEEAIAAGRREAMSLGLTNVRFEVRDVASIDDTEAYDLITAFDAIHDQAKPAAVLAGIARALRSDGVFLMVDIRASSNLEENVEHPLGTFLYTASTMHCMTVSLALDGDGLGTAWGEQLAIEMLTAAGFGSVDISHVEADISNSYYVARKS